MYVYWYIEGGGGDSGACGIQFTVYNNQSPPPMAGITITLGTCTCFYFSHCQCSSFTVKDFKMMRHLKQHLISNDSNDTRFRVLEET